MKIKIEKLSADILTGKPKGFVDKNKLMINEIDGVDFCHISIKGPQQEKETSGPEQYDVLLTFGGKAKLAVLGNEYPIDGNCIIKIPYDEKYTIHVDAGCELNYLLISKSLDDKDRQVIAKNTVKHQSLYLKALSDCPTYSEDIKSAKTVNRMILPEGMIPRFCMGSVETEGPDEVAEHDHPMLDQLFLGLPDCQCNCQADGSMTVFSENEILHIPLGSLHSVSVDKGNKLSYIWMDFFLTLGGEKYMSEQHQMDE